MPAAFPCASAQDGHLMRGLQLSKSWKSINQMTKDHGDLSEREFPGPAVVPVPRSLRAPLSGGLGRTVRGLLRRGERWLVLDLARLEDIDAAGVGEIVAAFTATRAAGGAFRITRPRGRVCQLLRVAGLLGVLSADGEGAGVRRTGSIGSR